MSVIERCPKCGLFTNLSKNNGCCTHCGINVDEWWDKLNKSEEESIEERNEIYRSCN